MECFSSPKSALSFSFKVDNKLQRMRSAVHLRGKTCCSQIHLFDIIVLADPCPRPSEFLVLNISVAALPPLFSLLLPVQRHDRGSPPLWSTAPHKDLCRNRCVCRSKKWKIPAQNVSLPPSLQPDTRKSWKIVEISFFLRWLRRCQWLCAEITTVGIRGGGGIIRVW